jgi:hypothetical protein
MGLDNGITCHNIKIEDIPYWVKPPWDFDKYNEIVYFRKHWGIRGEILEKLYYEKNNNSYSTIESEDIIPIVKILMKYLDKEYYEDNANSIWEYEEAYDHIQQSIINLMWLKVYMESHPDVECVFYDSW